jgi:hypothetical protein
VEAAVVFRDGVAGTSRLEPDQRVRAALRYRGGTKPTSLPVAQGVRVLGMSRRACAALAHAGCPSGRFTVNRSYRCGSVRADGSDDGGLA